MRRSHSLVALFLSTPLAFIACADPMTPPAGTGGSGSGGVGSGGAPLGTGGASGGAPAATGGSSSGGSSTGGAGTGGAGTGGAGTGGAGTGGAGTGGAGSGGDSGGEFTLTSTAFADGEPIPEGHTCADPANRGQNMWGAAPPLVWENPPEGTMSYAFFMIDETLTTKTPPDVNGNHSGAWNIPTTITELEEGWGLDDLGGAVGINDGYLGPCPNLVTQGNTDTYMLILLAMPMASYSLSYTGTAGVRDAYAELKALALDEQILRGTSDAVN